LAYLKNGSIKEEGVYIKFGFKQTKTVIESFKMFQAALGRQTMERHKFLNSFASSKVV
jgi:hypothetical protein